MAENDSSNSSNTAIVTIVAIIAVAILAYLAVQALRAQTTDQIEIPDASDTSGVPDTIDGDVDVNIDSSLPALQ